MPFGYILLKLVFPPWVTYSVPNYDYFYSNCADYKFVP